MVKRQLSSQESHEEQPILRRKGLQSLLRGVSPPPKQRRRIEDRKRPGTDQADVPPPTLPQKSTAAAIEAGELEVVDHIAFYSVHLLSAIRPHRKDTPRLAHANWLQLYTRNAGSLKGCHFVVHQHDHPVAGTHYDLRLQCNPTSSISFAIMYGLPGDPNSRRLNRNATETRVHCLWNHLVEIASLSTGSMLIWDTGEFEVLPYEAKSFSSTTTEEDTDSDDDKSRSCISGVTEQEKLRQSFLRRKVKLRLYGTRLPEGYTLSLRLTKANDRHEQPKKPSRRRRRVVRDSAVTQPSDSDSSADHSGDEISRAKKKSSETSDTGMAAAVASDDEDEMIRANNAYPGATNDIGSIHQRRWYLSIDRKACGFEKQTAKSASGFISTVWVRKTSDSSPVDSGVGAALGFERFVVGGRDTERSVVTGRLGSEILADEGVVGYVPRGLWRPITI